MPAQSRQARRIRVMNASYRRVAVVLLLALILLAGWWAGYRQAATVAAATSHSQSGHGSLDAPLLASMRLPEGARVDPAIRACERALMEAFNSRARDLRLRPDAVSQVAYALAPPHGTPDDAEEWGTDAALRIGELRLAESRRHLLHAASLAPGDMRIQWLAAIQCEGGPGCGQVMAALLAKDPDNMAGWLHELVRARRANDGNEPRFAHFTAQPMPSTTNRFIESRTRS